MCGRFDVIRYEMLAVLVENSVRSGSNCNVLLRPESDQAWKQPILSSSRSLSSSPRKPLAGGSVADHPGMDDRQLDRHCFSELADDELSRGGIGCIELSSRRRDDGNGQEGVSLLCKTRLVISNRDPDYCRDVV